MENNKFTNQEIKKTLSKVISRYKLIPKHKMSTSGEFFVVTIKNKKQLYLLKIRKRKGESAATRFKNEIKILSYLKKKNIPGLILPTHIASDTRLRPEYLLYSFISGWPLNTFYIYIGKRLTPAFLKSNFLQIIQNIQQTNPPAQAKLPLFTFKENFNSFLLHKNRLITNANAHLYQRIKKIIIKNKYLLSQSPLTLTHGDINPKNLIITNNKLAIIDWSNIHLNNPLYDLSMLYMYAWNRPQIMELTRSFIVHNYPKISNPDKLHLLNRLILTPKFIGIMEDSISGIKKDKKNKIILAKTEKELINSAKNAIKKYICDAKKIVEHFEMWKKPLPIIKSIEKLYNFNTAKVFIKKQHAQLSLSKNWNLTQLHNHRLVVRSKDQKLISEYTLSNGKKQKVIMGKIRLERDDDLAKQSYNILINVWNCKQGKRLISKPLHYFNKEKVYFYEKTVGNSLGFLIEENKLKGTKQLNIQIAKAARLLATLHALPLSHFKKTNFINNYDINQQLFWFEHTTNNLPNSHTKKNLTLVRALTKIYLSISSDNTLPRTFIHGDCQLQNLILNKNTLKIIDFDNAEINDPLIDVGNFLNQINYKGLLSKSALKLRQIFLTTYLKNAHIKLNKKIINKINFYIIMGIIKNINFNFLESQNNLVYYDIKKIHYIYKHLGVKPTINLKNAKNFIAKTNK